MAKQATRDPAGPKAKRKGGLTGAEKGGLNNSARGLARFHLSVDRSLLLLPLLLSRPLQPPVVTADFLVN